MRRVFLVTAVVAAGLVWVGASALAQQDEFQLPPVKLRPDRPIQAKPIPPTPDDRAPSETPPAAPPKVETPPAETPKVEAPKVEPPPAPPAPPKVETPKVEAPKVEPPPPPMPPAVPAAPKDVAPPAPPVAPPVEMPKAPDLPPPAMPPVAAEPPAAPPAPAVFTPVEPPPVAPKATRPATKRPVRNATIETSAPTPPPAAPAAPPEKVVPPVLAAPVAAPRPELLRPESKTSDVQKEAMEAQVSTAPEVNLIGLGEVGLVEEVARTRKAYARALTALKDFYMARGNAYKIEWIDSEIAAFDKVPKIQYLVVAELAGPNLKPVRRIEAADQLFEEGMNYKNYPAFPPGKKDYLKTALDKFSTVVEKYPESDKIDDAAFRMGEIYGGWYFQDWARAVGAYERCWEWDPQTTYPALFNAAKIYDEKLKNRGKAVELYNRVVAEGTDPELTKQAVERLKALSGK